MRRTSPFSSGLLISWDNPLEYENSVVRLHHSHKCKAPEARQSRAFQGGERRAFAWTQEMERGACR